MPSSYNPFIEMEQDHSSYKYPDRFRKFFGEHSQNAEPMVSGFGMVFFTYLPPSISDTQNKYILTALCNNISVPGMSISAIEYDARDGGKWSVPGQATMDSNEITLQMWELVGIPIHKLISAWVSLLRNPQYGYMTEVSWQQANYKGKMLYCTCTPDMKVQYAKVYGGVWPTAIKDDAFNYDQASQDKVQFDVTFRFDHYPYTSPAIVSSAQSMVDAALEDVYTTVSTKYTDAAGTI